MFFVLFCVFLCNSGTDALYAGADFRANDGIYSRYFNEFTSDGAYSIRFRATGLAGSVVHIEDERSYGSGAPPLPDYRGKWLLTVLHGQSEYSS